MNIVMTGDGLGGVWNHVLELAHGLERGDGTIYLVVFGGKLSQTQRAEVSRLSNVHCIESELRLEWMEDPWEDVHAGAQLLYGLVTKVKPAVIHLNGYALAAEARWPAPVVVGAHSCVLSWWDAVMREPAPTRLNRYREEVAKGLAAADCVVAPTHSMLRDLRRIYQVDFPARVIANGIEPVHFAVGAKARQILSVGRMWDKAKNFQLLDSIAAKLEWPVLVAGEAVCPLSNTQHLFVHVRALGKLSAWAIREQFSRASIYAAPALYEPFGLAVLEAALSGCALILADIPTFRELWHGAAVLLNPRDAHAWEAELQRLIHDDEARIALAQEARARASNFSREAMCASYHDLYHHLSGNKREPSPRKAA